MQRSISEPDNVYFNVRINRSIDIPNARNYSNLAIYEATMNNSIIDNPSNYYLAITDYSIPLNSIPINIVRIVPNQPNPNLMTSKFSINYLGIEYSQNIIFIPSTDQIPPIQDKPYMVVTNYYFIYSYQYLLDAFNQTLSSLVAASGIPLPPGTADPYFFLDVIGDFPKINLVIPDFFITNNVVLGMNEQAVNYFGGFSLFFSPVSLDARYTFNLFTTNNVCDETGVLNPAGNYYLYQQEFYALPQWNVLNKIIISSSSLPIVNQQNTSSNLLSPDLIVQSPILYIEIPNYETISQAKNYSYMSDDAQYRLVDLVSTIPLKRIQIAVSWSDHYGEVFPLELQSFNSCNIQLGFFKKELYKSIK